LLLDLFCCAGGAAVGYHRAGFDVIGVDIHPQPNYPFRFEQADALDYLREELTLDPTLRAAAIHASPPCQGYTPMSNRYRGKGGVADSHPKLIDPVRELLIASGRPWIIENVVGARRAMRNPIILRGAMFGLGVDRPRLFESNVALTAPPLGTHSGPIIGVYGERADGRRLLTRKDGSELRAARSLEQGNAAMGSSMKTWRELAESIPPSYTEHLGRQILAHLAAQKAA
jgi:DNA (cytosine-5)-methyltransferase 1